jgi:predicted transcriptional regulator
MKTFTLKLERQPVKKMIAAMKRAVKTGIPEIHEHELRCGSVESMMRVISKSKFEAFAAIVDYKPKTLNELADQLHKDLGNVSRDVRSLEALGLIKLRKEDANDTRKVRPIALYDQILFDFSASSKKASGHP